MSDPGLVHRTNEDRWLADLEQGLYLVSDGMADDVAPQMVVDTLPDLLRAALAGVQDLAAPEAAERVRAALADMSGRVRDKGRSWLATGMLGATVVLALIRDDRALVAHLGDSRAYLSRAGRLDCLTRDHTRLQQALDRGELTADDAARYRWRGGPIRYVGMAGTAVPDIRSLTLQPADQLLLCSDGLTGMLSDDELLAILNRRLPPAESCRQLIAAANRAGGTDNVTALVIAVSAGPT